MSNYHAISRERYGQQRWQRQLSYTFAAADAVAALTAVELPKAVMSLPVGFIQQGEGFIPAAVLSLQPGVNLFVAPDWRWIGNYIPAVFRAYPFRLMHAEDGKQVLCINEDSGLVTDGPLGEPFFAEDGQPDQSILEILAFLKQVEESRVGTVTACAVLQKHHLIQPWPVSCKTESGEKPVSGLFQIDEAALNKLPGEALQELTQTGALMVAYCQLLSMQHLPTLSQLAEAHAQAAAKARDTQNLAASGLSDLSFFSKNGTISFAGLI